MSKLRFFSVCLLSFLGLALVLRLTKPTPSPPLRHKFIAPQTWHLTGWRKIAGKQVAWEIWGQSQPLFCYERIGESLRLVQDEKESLLTPPLPGYAQILVKNLPALPNNRLLLLQHWGEGEDDPATGLPLHYRISTTEKTEGKKTQGEAELTAHYNLPIPKEIQALPRFSGYSLDLAKPLQTVPPQENFASGHGFMVQGQVLSQDTEGNLRIRIALQPGQPGAPKNLPFMLRKNEYAIPLALRPIPLPLLGPDSTRLVRPDGGVGRGGGGMGGAPPLAMRRVRDEHGAIYIKYLPLTPEDSATEYLLLRETPLPQNAPPPKTLRVVLSVDLRWVTELTGYFRPFVFHKSNEQLLLTLPRSLPTQPVSPEEHTLFAKARQQYRENLEMEKMEKSPGIESSQLSRKARA
ncbi:hypothetical protein [Armatimonas sp.]|uniref:hypothetical protein n=1 Tax=Armatimonas sp. TaxID=1872638 RepID=UPI00374FE0FB